MSDWCTIESDPGVFTELIEKFGCEGVEMEELFSLDSIAEQVGGVAEKKREVYGVIFLFRYGCVPSQASSSSSSSSGVVSVDDHPLWFANQVITNACATQAIVSVLLNQADKLVLGTDLADMLSFTATLPAHMKGLALSNSEKMRLAHNSFRQPSPFVSGEAQQATDDDEVFHFVAYLPKAGRLWELDGLKPGPVDHGLCTDQDWLGKLSQVLQRRVDQFPARAKDKFQAMVLVQTWESAYNKQLDNMRSRVAQGAAAQSDLDRLELERAQKLEEEREKRANWHKENVRRRHDYLPFVCGLLEKLAETGNLKLLVDRALEKEKASNDRAAAATAAGKDQKNDKRQKIN